MRYKVWYDASNHLVRAEVLESLTKEDAEDMMMKIEAELLKNDTRLGIMDLSHAGSIKKVSKETREVYKEHAKRLSLDKAAVIVDSPVLRMIARVALTALGQSGTAKFVKSEHQALRWLKSK
jgi:hypothetical protein